jgi:hypothetical protein
MFAAAKELEVCRGRRMEGWRTGTFVRWINDCAGGIRPQGVG